MTFTPIVPFGGYLGWRVFDNTAERQLSAFSDSPQVVRDVDYFRENIASATTAEDLVSDRRLLRVALGAYGLSEEINKQAFVQRILEEGTEQRDSFANRLNDPRWRAFAEDFGYGNAFGARVDSTTFRERTANNYLERAFEERVGEVNTNFRLALNFRREIARIAEGPSVDNAGWFQIFGQPPLRAVVETALGLPSSIGTADIDQQRDLFERRSQQVFGNSSPAVFKDPVKVEDALRRFFLQTEIQNGPSATTPGFAALSILSPGAGQSANLFLSLVS